MYDFMDLKTNRKIYQELDLYSYYHFVNAEEDPPHSIMIQFIGDVKMAVTDDRSRLIYYSKIKTMNARRKTSMEVSTHR